VPVISSKIDTRSPGFRDNEQHYRALIGELREKRSVARAGGDAAAKARHVGAGKMLARQRVDALMDAGSPFL